jgi:hypothetical protein
MHRGLRVFERVMKLGLLGIKERNSGNELNYRCKVM